MVTKSDLLKQRVNQEIDKVEQAELKKQQAKQKEALRQAEDMCRVETMLDTDLGEILETTNAAGLSTIRLGYFRVWRLSEGGGGSAWDRYYDHQSPLRFEPKKGYPPTIRLIEILEQAGFCVSLGIEPCQNARNVVAADGYAHEKEPTYPVYFMQIDWPT
jgi:hypothetical protein